MLKINSHEKTNGLPYRLSRSHYCRSRISNLAFPRGIYNDASGRLGIFDCDDRAIDGEEKVAL